MFNLHLRNAGTIGYSLLKLIHVNLCRIDSKIFSPHCCKCNSFGCIAAIRCGSACHGHHSDSVYSGSKHSQFDSPMLVKRKTDFPNPRRGLIGSNYPWRVNDSPYYHEFLQIIRELSRQTDLKYVGLPFSRDGGNRWEKQIEIDLACNMANEDIPLWHFNITNGCYISNLGTKLLRPVDMYICHNGPLTR